jgi:hypothetical protein
LSGQHASTQLLQPIHAALQRGGQLLDQRLDLLRHRWHAEDEQQYDRSERGHRQRGHCECARHATPLQPIDNRIEDVCQH